jgi:hypothetical protein
MYPNSPNIRMHLLTLEMIPNTMGVMSYHFKSKKEVIGINFSITSREYYESKRSDIRIDIAVKVQGIVYDGSKYVDIGQVIYKIERTYQSGQFIELYLKRTAIKLGDIIDYPR